SIRELSGEFKNYLPPDCASARMARITCSKREDEASQRPASRASTGDWSCRSVPRSDCGGAANAIGSLRKLLAPNCLYGTPLSGAIPAGRSAPALAGRHLGPARQAGGRTQTIPFTLAQRASGLIDPTHRTAPCGLCRSDGRAEAKTGC